MIRLPFVSRARFERVEAQYRALSLAFDEQVAKNHADVELARYWLRAYQATTARLDALEGAHIIEGDHIDGLRIVRTP